MTFKLSDNKYKYKVCNTAVKLTLVMAVLFFSCSQKREERKIERSFYYWKSVYKLTDFEEQRIDSLKVKTIYIKFFDVDWDEAAKQPLPKAIIRFNDSTYKDYHVIPTIFITTQSIKKIDSSQVMATAIKITGLIKEIIFNNLFKEVSEIQIDCDWTADTKGKYFSLLQNIKKLHPNNTLSATIRLHQIKFFSKTGVPPADRGLLMCYNMGNLKNPSTTNSIIESAELKKYISHLSNYALPLDVGLPLFNWKVLFRNNVYSGLIENLSDTIFTNSFSLQKDNRFKIIKDTLLAGYDFKKGDILRNEQSDFKEILSAAGEVNKQLKNTRPRVSFYHLDAVILNKYTFHELETIYNSLQ